jgi:LPXTG-motif cell wall-anchored protein
VKNNGRGTLDGSRSGGEPVLRFIFQVPPGTEVTSAPARCESVIEQGGGQIGKPGAPGGTYYRCFTGTVLVAGDSFSAAFKLKITSVIPNATGTVGFDDKYASPPDWMHDDVPANDKASVVINPSTGGTGGGSGSLPITGAQTGLLAGTGALLLLLGGVMYALARRRQSVH